jgi:hypothetical protein
VYRPSVSFYSLTPTSWVRPLLENFESSTIHLLFTVTTITYSRRTWLDNVLEKAVFAVLKLLPVSHEFGLYLVPAMYRAP